MSQENVEIVKEAVERFNRGDGDAVFDDLYDAEAVYYSREDEPDTGVYWGREAIKGLARMWESLFENFSFDVDRYAETGEFVIAAGSISVRSRGSDAAVREPYVWLTAVRDRKIVEVREFREVREALEAAGLSE
jgi:ketosteroid isomerase-like protein